MGCLKTGFLFVVKCSLSFIVLGIVKILENRIVVLSGKCCSGCKVIFEVNFVFLYSVIKLFVWVWVVWYLGR